MDTDYRVGDTYRMEIPGQKSKDVKIYKIAEINNVRYIYIRFYSYEGFSFLQMERIPENEFEKYAHNDIADVLNLAIV